MIIPARRRSRCAWEGTLPGMTIEPLAFLKVHWRSDKLNTPPKTLAGRQAASKALSNPVHIAQWLTVKSRQFTVYILHTQEDIGIIT